MADRPVTLSPETVGALRMLIPNSQYNNWVRVTKADAEYHQKQGRPILVLLSNGKAFWAEEIPIVGLKFVYWGSLPKK